MPFYPSKLRKQTDNFISTLRQKPGQTALSFAQEVISNGRRMYPDASEDTALKWLMMTADPWVINVALVRQPQTVDQFLDILYSIDSCTLMRHGCVGPFSQLEEMWALRGHSQQPLESSTGNNERPTENYKTQSNIKCFSCGQRGHRYNNCPNSQAQNSKRGDTASFGYNSGYANQTKTYQNSNYKSNKVMRGVRAGRNKPAHPRSDSSCAEVESNFNQRNVDIQKTTQQVKATHANSENLKASRKRKQKFLGQMINKTLQDGTSLVEFVHQKIYQDGIHIGFLTKQEGKFSSSSEHDDMKEQMADSTKKLSTSKKKDMPQKVRAKIEITESGLIYQNGVHIGHIKEVENETISKIDSAGSQIGLDSSSKSNDILSPTYKLDELEKQESSSNLTHQSGLEEEKQDDSLTHFQDSSPNSKQREEEQEGSLVKAKGYCQLESDAKEEENIDIFSKLKETKEQSIFEKNTKSDEFKEQPNEISSDFKLNANVPRPNDLFTSEQPDKSEEQQPDNSLALDPTLSGYEKDLDEPSHLNKFEKHLDDFSSPLKPDDVNDPKDFDPIPKLKTHEQDHVITSSISIEFKDSTSESHQKLDAKTCQNLENDVNSDELDKQLIGTSAVDVKLSATVLKLNDSHLSVQPDKVKEQQPDNSLSFDSRLDACKEDLGDHPNTDELEKHLADSSPSLKPDIVAEDPKDFASIPKLKPQEQDQVILSSFSKDFEDSTSESAPKLDPETCMLDEHSLAGMDHVPESEPNLATSSTDPAIQHISPLDDKTAASQNIGDLASNRSENFPLSYNETTDEHVSLLCKENKSEPEFLQEDLSGEKAQCLKFSKDSTQQNSFPSEEDHCGELVNQMPPDQNQPLAGATCPDDIALEGEHDSQHLTEVAPHESSDISTHPLPSPMPFFFPDPTDHPAIGRGQKI